MEDFIQEIKVDSFHPFYEKALNEMLKAGGKRFRPKLLLAVVRAYNPLLEENAKYAAFAGDYSYLFTDTRRSSRYGRCESEARSSDSSHHL
jgi:geranylgeranyl pyrophosphate synthase